MVGLPATGKSEDIAGGDLIAGLVDLAHPKPTTNQPHPFAGDKFCCHASRLEKAGAPQPHIQTRAISWVFGCAHSDPGSPASGAGVEFGTSALVLARLWPLCFLRLDEASLRGGGSGLRRKPARIAKGLLGSILADPA